MFILANAFIYWLDSARELDYVVFVNDNRRRYDGIPSIFD